MIAEPVTNVLPSPARLAYDPPRWVMVAIVGAFVLIGHLQAVGIGLFLDDHVHFRHLREFDWSFRSAVESARLGYIGEIMDIWGRKEVSLRFFRPIAFWIMKLEYTLVRWQPMPMHIFSLGWHFLCSMMVAVLALRFFGSRLWATVAGSMMAIHPAHVVTVQWIACQTELLATTFLLLGTLAYAHYARWSLRVFPSISPSPTLQVSPSVTRSRTITESLCGIAALLFYILALGCRENAVLFPLVCWAGDQLCGPSTRRRMRWEHLLMLLILAAYLWLRWTALGGFPVPEHPYVRTPSDPDFLSHVLRKAVYYAIGLFGFVPVVPTGGQAYFDGRPLLFYGTFAGVLGVLVLIGAVYRFHRALLWAMVWTACFVLPLIPLLASPYHLYLPGVGAVLWLTAGLAALGGVPWHLGKQPKPLHVAICAVSFLLLGTGLGLVCWASSFTFRTGTLTEDILVNDVVRRGPPLRSGDDLFFINMPMLVYYAGPATETQTGVRPLHAHVLTFSPWLIRMETPGEVEVLDEHRLRVRCPRGDPYFGGLAGTAVLETMRLKSVPVQGEPIKAGVLFTVIPTKSDASGIEEIDFVFSKPLDSPEFHFYFGSPQFLAYPLEVKRQK